MRRLALLALVAAGVLAGPAASARAAASSASAAGLPRVSAPAAILLEPTTGQAVYERHADQERAIASTTKIMTALLTLERRSPSSMITTPPYAAGGAESQIGLRAGEHMSVADLLTGLLLPSANDAANALAVRIGGTRAHFVTLMNRHARKLHLKRTHFSTPVGLDTPGNYSTARELAKMAIALRAQPFARKVMDEKRAVLRTGAHRRVVVNRNDLVARFPWINGVKTGHTLQAGYVLVGSARRNGDVVHLRGHGHPLGGRARRRLARAPVLRRAHVPRRPARAQAASCSAARWSRAATGCARGSSPRARSAG